MRRLGLVAVSVIAVAFAPLSLPITASATVPEAPSVSTSVGAVADPVEILLTGESQTPVTSADREFAADALAAAEEAFHPTESSDEKVDATLALRDVAITHPALARAPWGSALAQSQRPWDDNEVGTTRNCPAGSNVCVHWATTSQATGRSQDITREAWAQGTVVPTMKLVSDNLVKAGYRKPVPDSRNGTNPYSSTYKKPVNWGGSGATDIYLVDLPTTYGPGLYGYCAFDLDDRGRLIYYPVKGKGATPAFCVLDNDFSMSQYRASYKGQTSADILKITAAHEYFHAVQFAYDAFEDAWFMESTATWMESQLFPSIPDSLQYLPRSQIRNPATSLDSYDAHGGAFQYSGWLYFQYLTERLGTKTGPIPNLVLQMWNYADSLGRDQYSIQAVASALKARKADFVSTFADYSAANRRPAQAYRNGKAFPTPRAAKTVRVKGKQTKSGKARIDHLASNTVRFKPKKTKRSKAARITVDMSNRAIGTAARATVFYKNGKVKVKRIKLNKSGNGSVRVAFGAARVTAVELTLVNANRSYKACSSDTRTYSCGGYPTRDNMTQRWKIKA